jgi:hypothetical protein
MLKQKERSDEHSNHDRTDNAEGATLFALDRAMKRATITTAPETVTRSD